MRKQILNGRDVALISPRRIGKSGLIRHLFNQEDIRDKYHVFFVDIYATTSLAEFVYILGKEIYEQLKPKSTSWKERFFQIVTSFRIGFKLDSMTGNPSFDLGLGDIQAPQTTLDEARKNVIMAQESSYKDLLSNLAPRQKVVLQAIAKEGLAQNITSSKFIKKYNLNSASSLKFNSLYIPTLFLYLIDNMIFIQCIEFKIIK